MLDARYWKFFACFLSVIYFRNFIRFRLWDFCCFPMRYRNTTKNNYVATCLHAEVLSKGVVPVWLWISWANGTICIGIGNVTGQNMILYYPENFLIANISTVAVSSFGIVTGDWKIPYNQSEGEISCTIKLHRRMFAFVGSSTWATLDNSNSVISWLMLQDLYLVFDILSCLVERCVELYCDTEIHTWLV